MTEPLEELKGIKVEQVIWDELAEELAKQHTEQLSLIIIHPEVYEHLTEALDTSFFGKLKWGWKLFALSWSDWKDAMSCEDYVEEFFYYLGYSKEL